ncbi:hypothetical protein CSUI_011197 [Cystoisospora suis]|uniref:Uncharacterized protein n=1 Tax=Cystoisospora suis TaxID=483139 RepID=A0A2C6KF44_9APIC|nr:hypothetical protein CSUI_011197 [Cystoisospora suis]
MGVLEQMKMATLRKWSSSSSAPCSSVVTKESTSLGQQQQQQTNGMDEAVTVVRRKTGRKSALFSLSALLLSRNIGRRQRGPAGSMRKRHSAPYRCPGKEDDLQF